MLCVNFYKSIAKNWDKSKFWARLKDYRNRFRFLIFRADFKKIVDL